MDPALLFVEGGSRVSFAAGGGWWLPFLSNGEWGDVELNGAIWLFLVAHAHGSQVNEAILYWRSKLFCASAYACLTRTSCVR